MPLIIVGEGPERSRLEALVHRLDLEDHIRFTGAIAPEAVGQLLAKADLMLMPAKAEGLGLAAAEALIQGVPVVVCSDGGGLLDVVADGAGGRVTSPDADAIAVAITETLSDPSANEAAARSGLVWRERLSPEQVATRCLNWYQRVLAA